MPFVYITHYMATNMECIYKCTVNSTGEVTIERTSDQKSKIYRGRPLKRITTENTRIEYFSKKEADGRYCVYQEIRVRNGGGWPPSGEISCLFCEGVGIEFSDSCNSGWV